MNKLVILDWDDTLFPTYWTIENSIDVSNEPLETYSTVDNVVADLLRKLVRYSIVVIVTNASTRWIDATVEVLPQVKDILDRYTVQVISAREMYQDVYPNSVSLWKKHVFRNLEKKYSQNSRTVKEIISVGDADYEFNALTDLYNHSSSLILKTVRFMKQPSYNTLVDQLSVLSDSVKDIYSRTTHTDLIFEGF